MIIEKYIIYVFSLDDFFNTIKTENLPIPLSISEESYKASEFINDFLFYEINLANKNRTKIINHCLLKKLEELLFNCDPPYLILFSVHDFIINYLVNGLEFPSLNPIPFCSTFCIEKYENASNKVYFFKLKFNSNYFQNPKEKDSNVFSYQDLKERICKGKFETDEKYIEEFGQKIEFDKWYDENWEGYIQNDEGKTFEYH